MVRVWGTLDLGHLIVVPVYVRLIEENIIGKAIFVHKRLDTGSLSCYQFYGANEGYS